MRHSFKIYGSLVFAAFCLQNTAQAYTAAENQCFAEVQGKVAWNRAGSTTWSEGNIRALCQNTTRADQTISCFKQTIALFDDWGRGLNQCAGLANTVGYASYDINPYQKDPNREDNWTWIGGTTRTIYNPLDGGVLLKYTLTTQGNADGCSGGASRERQLFQQACLAHDTNYDAPFSLAGFPRYPNGASLGQDMSDFLFYQDMLRINEHLRAKNDALTNSINNTAADAFYTAVTLGGQFRDRSAGKTVVEKGGVVAVVNSGVYVMNLLVKWTAPDGSQKTYEARKAVGQTAVVPLSVGARNIEITASAVAGTTIFKKSFAQAGIYPFTVKGTTLINSVVDGLENDARNSVGSAFRGKEIGEGQRAIQFSHQAGYVAEMSVTYFVNQNLGGVMIPLPKVESTGKITAGIQRSIVIPQDIVKTQPITVSITGVGTFKNNVFFTTVNGDFSGQLCYKAWGTIFSPQGGACK